MSEQTKEQAQNSGPLKFEDELARVSPEMKQQLVDKEKSFKPLIQEIEKRGKDKVMGFYVTGTPDNSNPQMPKLTFEKMTLHFLFDDFEKPLQFFDPKIFFAEVYENLIIEKKVKDERGQEALEFYLKEDPSIRFDPLSISILRENCYDSIYDDLKTLGSSLVYKDNRGFISALKTIDIHRNMILQKFEKYVVVYAGAGSWLRGEKSNDFDVFIVIDDTDVKKMSRLQVKDQLTKIIWQMSHEVARLTGIQIHIQVYLLTDFWDALKDAHPVMFTFLRDGVPFYDRGLYSSWKELLKLGKIKPSPEAIDLHMNAGSQLIDRAKKMLADIVMNDIYYAVLNPSQAILMLKGYNPTTPKETVKMFKEVLLEKDKDVTKKDVATLEHAVKMFKAIEHDKSLKVSGKEVDDMISDAEKYLDNMKKMFEDVTEQRTKDSLMSSYNELLNQMRTLPGLFELEEKKLLAEFQKQYVEAKKLPSFVKKSFAGILKAKDDYDKGSISITEVNKILKEVRNVLTEIKSYRDKSLLDEVNRRRLVLTYDGKGTLELLNYENQTYLLDTSQLKTYVLDKTVFKNSDKKKEDFVDNTKLANLEIDEALLTAVKKAVGAKSLSF